MSQQLPPPGWYADHREPQVLRWWDGMQWTPHTRPLAGVPQPPPSAWQPHEPRISPVPAQARQESAPARRKPRAVPIIAGAFGAFLVLVIAIHAGTGGSGSQGATAATATSSAASTTSAAAPASKPRTVATFSGSGQDNTARFTVTSTWKLDYSFSCASFGQAGNFVVLEDGGSDLNGVTVNELAMSKSSSTFAYNDAGSHYLQVNSECSWTMKVVDEP